MEEVAELRAGPVMSVMAVLAGLALLVGGAELLVRGATGLARSVGVSEAVIGLTVVAVGTSLPELATSVVAAVRRHADVAVGNVVGSNIFNLLGILGVTALLRPLPVGERIARVDIWVMLAVAVAVLLLMRSGWRLSRVEGLLCLAVYALYTGLML
jgi:cation:H+ antiporter